MLALGASGADLAPATSGAGLHAGKDSGLRSRRLGADACASGKRPFPHLMRRGSYNSGDDFVLEYGELRFTFNDRDFGERCEQAARRLGFVGGELGEDEAEDLVNLVVNGAVSDPASGLGEHINDCWPDLVGPADKSLVHWLRRLIFRSAWLDHRVKEGELAVAFAPCEGSFRYVQPDRGDEPIELAPEPSWNRVAYTPRERALARRYPPSVSARARAMADAPSSPTRSSGRSVPLAGRSSAGERFVLVSARWRAATVVSPPWGVSAVAMSVREPASGIARAAASALRAA